MLKTHGPLPLTVESGENPFSSSASNTKVLNDDPVGRIAWVVMLYWKNSKPGPPTIARTAPVEGSTDTTALVPVRGSPVNGFGSSGIVPRGDSGEISARTP